MRPDWESDLRLVLAVAPRGGSNEESPVTQGRRAPEIIRVALWSGVVIGLRSPATVAVVVLAIVARLCCAANRGA